MAPALGSSPISLGTHFQSRASGAGDRDGRVGRSRSLRPARDRGWPVSAPWAASLAESAIGLQSCCAASVLRRRNLVPWSESVPDDAPAPCYQSLRMSDACSTCGRRPILVHVPTAHTGYYCAECCPGCTNERRPLQRRAVARRPKPAPAGQHGIGSRMRKNRP